MASRYGVAARLFEGLPAVEDFSTYVWACRMRGYSHPELTVHPGQVRELYSTEDGLDLAALDADCAALRDGATGLREAMALTERQPAALAAGWTGFGADSSVDFLQRHCAAAQLVATAWRDAAVVCAALCEELWRAVDGRVAATATAARAAQPQSWLPAARAVLAGDVDEATVAIVDQHVRPFVDTVIGQQWVGDMRSATAAVRAAYRTALDGVRSAGRVQFEIPGDLGPRADLGTRMVPVGLPAAPVARPAAAAAPMPEPVAATPAATPLPEAPAAAPAPAAPLTLPELGGLADSSRLGQPDVDPAEPASPSEHGLESDEALPDDDAEPEAADDGPEEESEPEAEPNSAEPDPGEPEPVPPTEPEPVPEPPVAVPAAPSAPDCPEPAPATPCEMAADELPQVGQ